MTTMQIWELRKDSLNSEVLSVPASMPSPDLALSRSQRLVLYFAPWGLFALFFLQKPFMVVINCKLPSGQNALLYVQDGVPTLPQSIPG
ncbi:hypothetical protein [Deinococcus sp. UR1]|uniref:hypothetical protein n=1 Tax=Deinococcus sp. UR1 TaxID=1704277 RepID=UPI0013041547|nr:hypothetical protein [Deinococcus sp. UR1]